MSIGWCSKTQLPKINGYPNLPFGPGLEFNCLTHTCLIVYTYSVQTQYEYSVNFNVYSCLFILYTYYIFCPRCGPKPKVMNEVAATAAF